MTPSDLAGRRTPAAEALLAKFEELQADSIGLKEKTAQVHRLKAENEQLRKRLEELQSGQSETPAKSSTAPARDQESTSVSLKALRSQLESAGVSVSDAAADAACMDLHAQLQRGDCALSRDLTGSLLISAERVQVLLLAQVKGEPHCLMECSAAGDSQEVPGCIVQGQETWQEAAQKLVSGLFGVDAVWQAQHLRLDEAACEVSDTLHASAELKQLLTKESLRKATFRVQPAGAPEETLPSADGLAGDEPLKCIGLPAGGDFTTVGGKGVLAQARRHWRWVPLSTIEPEKDAQSDKDAKLEKFERYLADFGVDTTQFGSGYMKSLVMLFDEVENQETSLTELDDSEVDASGVRLLRRAETVRINLEVTVQGRRRALSSPKQFLADGRQRDMKRKLVVKVRAGENWKDALPRAFTERLGLDKEMVAECFELVPGREVHSEETIWSTGYPLRTRYVVHSVTMTVTDPEHEALECMGLPFGNDFVTKEGRTGGVLHVWTWDPVVSEEKSLQNKFNGTPYEELAKYLSDIQNIVQQTSSHEGCAKLGLGAPLSAVLDKVQRCIDTVVNFDSNMMTVDINDILGRMDGLDSQSLGRSDGRSEDLAKFIASNYLRSAPNKTQRVDLQTVPEWLSEGNPSSFNNARRVSSAGNDAPYLQAIIGGSMDWGLDLFNVDEMCEGSLVQSYGRAIMLPLCRSGLNCQRESVMEFLDVCASLYLDNAYHNAVHATQVCHTSVWLAENTGLAAFQSGAERAAYQIAAFCHDVKHFGRNNAFCINTKHELSMVYNDKAVLENMSSACCFQMMQGEGGRRNLLGRMPNDDQAQLRSYIIELILATDMSEHFELISKFRVRRQADSLNIEEEADRRFVSKMCLKAGDVSHSALPWDLHKQWSARVAQEFMEQGDEEKSLGLPLSPLCDRAKLEDLGKSQRGFLEFVCLPLYEELAGFQSDWRSAMELDDLQEEQAMCSVSSTASMKPKKSMGASGTDSMNSRVSGVRRGRRSATGSRGPAGRSPLARAMSRRLTTQDDTNIREVCIANLKDNAEKWMEETETVQALIVQLKSIPIWTPGAAAVSASSSHNESPS